ncbi:NAD(P)-dependent oxidoreductase [Streptomycetaceae bacterium NBC_01309]
MKVAVCGLGRMGRAFAEALVADGHEVTGWNRTPRGVPGVPMAATAADAARGAEAVVVTVFDGPAAEAVLLGPGGVLDGVAAAPGTVVVNATTLGPDESRALAAEAERAGARYVEAPVLGSIPAVRSGTVHVLLGGTPGDIDAAEPVLRAWSYAGTRRHVGPVGAASALKLAANLTLGAAVAGLHDAVRLGEHLGLRRADVLDVVQRGVLGRLVEGKRARLDDGDYEGADFTVGALAKDLALAVREAGDALPVTAAARRLCEEAAVANGNLDISSLAASAASGPKPTSREKKSAGKR